MVDGDGDLRPRLILGAGLPVRESQRGGSDPRRVRGRDEKESHLSRLGGPLGDHPDGLRSRLRHSCRIAGGSAGVRIVAAGGKAVDDGREQTEGEVGLQAVNGAFGDRCSAMESYRCCSILSSRGRVKEKQAPSSALLSAQTLPPCRWMMRWTSASPIPVPS